MTSLKCKQLLQPFLLFMSTPWQFDVHIFFLNVFFCFSLKSNFFLLNFASLSERLDAWMCQKVFWCLLVVLVSLEYEPASISKTRQCGTSDNLDATTEPPEPPPITMKSYSLSGSARVCNKIWLKFTNSKNFVFSGVYVPSAGCTDLPSHIVSVKILLIAPWIA